MSRIWQICIVGGGPAGCAAALTASLQPDQVLLLEAQSPWREKPCGDAITHSGTTALERLGVNAEDLRDLGGKLFAHIDIYARGERFLEFRGDDTTGWMVRRNKLDQLLRDRASRHCTVRYGATACGIRQDGHGFSITLANAEGKSREERCRFVIIATGARSQLSRRLGLSGNAINAPSLTTYRIRRIEPDFGLRFLFDKSLRPGYSWEFDADSDTVNIGVCALAGLPGHEIKKRSLAAAANWPSLPNSVWRGGSIPLWSGEGATWHSDAGLVSCGDAAGIADPLTAEGIGPALETGIWAGNCARNYVNGDGRRVLKLYSERIREDFTTRYCQKNERSLLGLLSGTRNIGSIAQRPPGASPTMN
jgi:geranylgeranyl reductase family protein